jgi:hypothetical protein
MEVKMTPRKFLELLERAQEDDRLWPGLRQAAWLAGHVVEIGDEQITLLLP